MASANTQFKLPGTLAQFRRKALFSEETTKPLSLAFFKQTLTERLHKPTDGKTQDYRGDYESQKQDARRYTHYRTVNDSNVLHYERLCNFGYRDSLKNSRMTVSKPINANGKLTPRDNLVTQR